MARGSLRKVDNGWEFIVDLGPDPATGARRQRRKQGFRTKREAEQAMAEVLRAVASGPVATDVKTTVTEYLTGWLETQSGRLRPTTYASYQIAIGRITKGLGKVAIQRLSPLQIEQFYGKLSRDGAGGGGALASKSVRNTHVVLRKALGDAHRLGLVSANPAAVARPPAAVRPTLETWDAEALVRFLDSLEPDAAPLYMLLATTGMRRGEVLGLRWADLDLDNQRLSVVHTVTTVQGKLVFGEPKTSRGRRVVYLDTETGSLLREQRVRQDTAARVAGGVWSNPRDLVFTNEFGAALHPDRVSRDFERRTKRLGLIAIRLHDLRHTYATLALKAGVHPKIVSEGLGHSTVGVTLDLYSHVTPSIARSAADVVSKQLSAARRGADASRLGAQELVDGGTRHA